MSVEFSRVPLDYLRDPNLFRVLRGQARKQIYENVLTEDEILLAQEIVAISPDHPMFHQTVQITFLGQRANASSALIAKVMHLDLPPNQPLMNRTMPSPPSQKVDPKLLQMMEKSLKLSPKRKKEKGEHKEPFIGERRSSKREGIDREESLIGGVGEKPVLSKKNSEPSISEIETTEEIDPAALLKDAATLKQITDTAVCIRYLFPQICSKLFKQKNQLKMLQRVVEFSLCASHSEWGTVRSLPKCFQLDEGEDLALLTTVVRKLLRNVTVSVSRAQPEIPKDIPLAEAFNRPPFNQIQNTLGFVKAALYVKYECRFVYGQYPQNERRILSQIFMAYALHDTLSCPFHTAVSIVSSDHAIANDPLASLVVRVNLGHAWEALPQESGGKLQVSQILAFPAFESRDTFEAFIQHIQKNRSSFTSFGPSKLATLLIAIWSRCETEPISLQDALQNSLTVNGLRRLLHSEDDDGNIRTCLESLERLSPPKHPTSAS